MIKILKKIDSFKQEEHLLITQSKHKGRSVFGGIMTLIIFILSFAFFIYSIQDWLQNKKLPKITQDIKNSENITYIQPDILAQFEFYRMSENDIDPFDPQNIIIQAILEINENENIIFREQLPYNSEKSKLNGYVQILQNVSLNLQSDGDSFLFTNYQIIFRECQEQFLKQGQKCADETIVSKFYQQTERWVLLTFYEEQINSKTKQIQKIPRRNYIYLQQNKTYYQDSALQIASCFLDTGFLFPNIEHEQFLYSIITSISELPQQYSQEKYGLSVPFIWYMSLSQLYTEQYVEYPKIQEILADVGSIIFPQVYNKGQLKSYYLNETIKIYYPEYSDLKVNFNILGQISSIIFQGVSQVGLQFEIWKKTYQKLQSTANQKASFINLQHEISQIQFLLLQQLVHKTIEQKMRIAPFYNEVANTINPSLIQQQGQNDRINSISQEDNNFNCSNDFGQFCYKEKKKQFH